MGRVEVAMAVSVAPSRTEADLRELLTRIDAKLDLLLQRQRRRVPTLTREDRERLARLLPAIGGALGSEPFLARDLFETNKDGLRVVLRGLTTIRIGLLLQRAEGQPVDGYLIERAGVELHTGLWRVVQVPGSGLPATSPRAPHGLA